MRTRLVLTHEAARHPLRARFPKPQLAALPLAEPVSDLKLFGMTFAAGFLAFTTYLF